MMRKEEGLFLSSNEGQFIDKEKMQRLQSCKAQRRGLHYLQKSKAQTAPGIEFNKNLWHELQE